MLIYGSGPTFPIVVIPATRTGKNILIVWWKRPCFGYLKLNTDGSSRGNPGPSSYGGFIRDSDGRWVCGYMGRMGNRVTSLVAELWALFKGFCLIQRKGLRDVIVETDCKPLLLLITLQDRCEKHRFKALIEHCKVVMNEHHCVVVHTYREGNQCADHLAKLGGVNSREYAVLAEPPACLMPLLMADAQGVGYERMPK